MSHITQSQQKSRGRIPALLLITLILFPIAMTMAGAQVAHEDPRLVLHTTSTASSDQISALLGHSLIYLDNVSYCLSTFNYTQAGHSYYQFNQSCAGLETMIWQLNHSDSGYDAIGSSLNSTNTGLAAFLDNANNYDHSRQLYNASVAGDDIANVSVYKVLVSDRYTRIIDSYDDIGSNISALSAQLQDKNIDTRPLQASADHLNSYVDWLNEDYGSLGIGANGSVLYCGANQSVVTIGSDVRLSAYLVDGQGQPLKNSNISFFVDNRLLGSNMTNDKGRGSLDYIVPATIQRDTLHAQAEYVPSEGAAPGVYSNPVLLHVTDLYTTISMHLDKSEASYGDTVLVSGQLTPVYGIYAGGRAVNILLGDDPAGAAVTDGNGSYEYHLPITPDTLAGDFMLNAVYQQSPGDLLLGSVSDETSLNVTAQDTVMTLNSSEFANLGSEAAFNGTLFSSSGRPVSGANVYLYIDDQLSGNGTTDDNGVYMIRATIPDNATAGSHEIFTSFNPATGASLRGSASGFANISFKDTGKKIDLQGVPLILFADDRLNLTGTLFSGAGAPLANKALNIRIAGLNATTAVTDEAGNFNASLTIQGGILPALSGVTVSDAGSSAALYDRQVLAIPFDQWKASGSLVILIAVISGAFVLVRRPRYIRSAREKISGAPAGQSPRPDFDVQREISQIKASMDKNDAKTALILIYAAARKAVALSGVEVTDAMTEDGFYDKVAATIPRIAPPLRYIVISYQSAVDTHTIFSKTELEMALKCLVYIDRELWALQGGMG